MQSFAVHATGLLNTNYDLELTTGTCTWLQADRAYICVGVVDVAPSKMPTALSDRRIEHRGSKQVYIGRVCSLIGEGIVEVFWDPLSCQAISHAYVKENISAHGSLRPRHHRCFGTTRYDHSTFSTIADILTMVQNWCTGTLRRESDQLWGAINTIGHLLR